ncbi:MAG: dihydroorotase [Spirochaetales bacterium]|nr:dihydroorotase [Spirochaetales bacterium]
MDRLVLRQPDDFHVHLRQGSASADWARDAQKAGFARVLVMPNTVPPVVDSASLMRYRHSLAAAAPGLGLLMTFKIMAGMTTETLTALKAAGAVAGKLYPEGVTTNSADGVRHLKDAYPVFEVMQELDLVLCLHGEDPGAFTFDREVVFLKDFRALRQAFPRLRIILEHISTREGLETVREAGERTAGTLTAHHLLYTFDDLAGGALRPHLFCKPLLKRSEDRAALQAAAVAGEKQFFFGSDSAPHAKSNKEAALCSAGCYTMPVSLPLLASFFEERGALEKLDPFLSVFGAEFYGLPRNPGQLVLERRPWVVPLEYHGAVPPNAGETLDWQLQEV